MPDLDGLETLRQIRHAHPSRAGHHAVGPAAPATRSSRPCALGAADYVLKPRRPGRRRRGGARSGDPQRARARVAERAKWRASARRWSEDPDGAQTVLGVRRGDAAGDGDGRSRRRQRRRRAAVAARAASARKSSRASSTAARIAGPSRSSRSTARRCRPTCSKASCSATSAARSPAPQSHARRQVRVRAARHDHARRDRRDAGCHCRPRFSTCCRIVSSRASAAIGRSRSTSRVIAATQPRPRRR